jgi:hypothetical protein
MRVVKAEMFCGRNVRLTLRRFNWRRLRRETATFTSIRITHVGSKYDKFFSKRWEWEDVADNTELSKKLNELGSSAVARYEKEQKRIERKEVNEHLKREQEAKNAAADKRPDRWQASASLPKAKLLKA